MSNIFTRYSVIDTLITSKTRVKLLLKFFLNSNSSSYLRALEDEFEESTNGIRVELNRFEEAGLLTSSLKSNKKYFKANQNHPLFADLHNILLKYVGLDYVIETILNKIGDVKTVYLSGDIAKGKDSKIIELLIISEGLDDEFLLKLVDKAEKLISRKIKFLVLSNKEFDHYKTEINPSDLLLIWQNEDIDFNS